jgi:hypothetical protein
MINDDLSSASEVKDRFSEIESYLCDTVRVLDDGTTELVHPLDEIPPFAHADIQAVKEASAKPLIRVDGMEGPLPAGWFSSYEEVEQHLAVQKTTSAMEEQPAKMARVE